MMHNAQYHQYMYYTCALCLVPHVSINNKCELFAFLFFNNSLVLNKWMKIIDSLFAYSLTRIHSASFFSLSTTAVFISFLTHELYCALCYILFKSNCFYFVHVCFGIGLGCRYCCCCFPLYSSATLLTAYRVCLCVCVCTWLDAIHSFLLL